MAFLADNRASDVLRRLLEVLPRGLRRLWDGAPCPVSLPLFPERGVRVRPRVWGRVWGRVGLGSGLGLRLGLVCMIRLRLSLRLTGSGLGLG